MKVLFHMCSDYMSNPMPVEFCDGNGKLYIIPHGEPMEFENEFMALKILEILPYMGIVEVNFTKSRGGITYDIEEATGRALEKLEVEEKKCIYDYIRGQLEDRVSRNFPPLPPVGRALSCVIKHKVDLAAQGIKPIGWEPPYECASKNVVPQIMGGSSQDERIAMLEKLIVQQQALIEALTPAKRSQAIETPAEPVAPAPPKPEKARRATVEVG